MSTPTPSGVKTAALILMNIEQPYAAEVMKHLSESEVEMVTAEIIRHQDTDPEKVKHALGIMHALMHGHFPPVRGGRDLAGNLLRGALGPDKAQGVLAKVSQQMGGTSFEFLNSIEPSHVATMLEGEMPQMIALVLAHMPTTRAAQVLAQFPQQLRTVVAQSMAGMSSPGKESVTLVAETLKNRSGVFAIGDGSPEAMGGVQPLVDIINRSDASVEKAILADLDAVDPELAENVRARMFTFADIVILQDRDAQLVLRGVDIKQLALALKNAPEAVSEVITRNMTARNRETLESEMDLLGAVRLSQVEEARAEIVRHIRELEENGQITVERGEAAEYVT